MKQHFNKRQHHATGSQSSFSNTHNKLKAPIHIGENLAEPADFGMTGRMSNMYGGLPPHGMWNFNTRYFCLLVATFPSFPVENTYVWANLGGIAIKK